MPYLIAFFLVVFSEVAVCANEFKETFPVQNNTAETVLQLTPKEQAWLTKHKNIRLAYDGSLPPYSFINDQGKIDGIAVEIMAILSQRLGINFVIYPDSSWSDLYRAVAKRKVDMVATMVNRPDRVEWFRFTKPYLTKSLVIVTKENNKAINTRNDLADKKVAVVQGYQYGEQVSNEFPTAHPVIVKSMLDSLNEVDKGQADAAILFLGTANYLQVKHQLNHLKITAFYDRNSANESIAVRKDWPVLVGILQKGLDSLTEEEVQKIFAKWIVQAAVVPTAEEAKEKAPPVTPPPAPLAVTPPATKKVVEIEQQPPGYISKKAVPEPIAPTNEAYRLAGLVLIVLTLFGLWFYLVRKQKKLKQKAKNGIKTSANTVQSPLDVDKPPMIAPTFEMSAAMPMAKAQPELSVGFNIEDLRSKDEIQPGFSPDEIVHYQRDGDGRFSYVSASITNLLGYSQADFMENCRQYLTDNPENQHLDSLIDACMQGQPNELYHIEIYDSGQDIHWLEVNDSPVYDGQGHCIGIEGVMRDVTAQRSYELLAVKSPSEPVAAVVADLPFTLEEHLQLAINSANLAQKSFALISLRLERLRFLDGNLLGYPEVEVLKEASKRLRATLRDTDIVFELEADKYALILTEADDHKARLIVDKIRKILQVPYLLGVQSIVLETNMSITIYPGHGLDPEALINHAQNLPSIHPQESASVKKAVEYDIEAEDSLKLQQDLVLALDECRVSLRASSPHNLNALHRYSQFSVYYQSQHKLEDYTIMGFEALIRWQHPELGMLLPKDFVDLVKDIGMLDVMTYWIIQQVSFQAVAWEKLGIRPKLMVVNLDDLASKQAVEASKIIDLIKETGAQAEWISFSVPEKEIAKKPDLVIPIIRQLVDAGLFVSIDDFGSDGSVLDLIKTIPAQFVEFDPVYIRSLSRDISGDEIITYTIAMLHELGKTVIAKEIETEEQLAFLKKSDCDIIQGHLLSRAIPAKEAKKLIETLPDFAWYLTQ